MNSELERIYRAEVYAGGNPTMQERRIWSYRYWRNLNRPADHARGLAAADAGSNTKRYPQRGSNIGRPWVCAGYTLRWIESPEAAGFCFVNFADEIVSLRHTGWFSQDEMVGELYRGAVYRLSGNRGFVAGYRGGERRKFQDAAVIQCEIFDSEQDAALRADAIASRCAQHEREYQEAWQRGSRYAMLGDAVVDHRKTALELIAEIKAHNKRFTTLICRALREELSRKRRLIQSARKERADLLDVGEWWKREFAGAFNDGAGAQIFLTFGLGVTTYQQQTTQKEAHND